MSTADATKIANAPQDVTRPLACVSIEIDGHDILELEVPKEMAAMLSLHNETVNRVVAEHGGYRCIAPGKRVMAVFKDVPSALGFALALQQASFSADWGTKEADLYYQELEPAAAADAAAYGALWNGPRLKIGVHFGFATTISKRKDSELLQFAGEVVSVAQRVQEAASGGQILATKAALDAAGSDAPAALKAAAATPLGAHEIPWIAQKLELTQLLPQQLAGRTFPKSYIKPVAAAAAGEKSGDAQPSSPSSPSSPSKVAEELRGKVEAARSSSAAAANNDDDAAREIVWLKARRAEDADRIAALEARVAKLEALLPATASSSPAK